jgi:hypothetical protein
MLGDRSLFIDCTVGVSRCHFAATKVNKFYTTKVDRLYLDDRFFKTTNRTRMDLTHRH